jgi:hypothetical protein
MKIDMEYLKGLLEAFQLSEKPTTDIEELKGRGFDYDDDKFIFHLQILADRNLVEQEDGDGGLGYFKSIDGFVSWSVLPLRLTASGHDFIEALANKEVWQKVKTEFKGASISTLITVSKKLLEGYLSKKVEEILK